MLSLLDKGLTFIPSFNFLNYATSLWQDILDFKRRLLLASYFQHLPPKKTPLFVARSDWTPTSSFLSSPVHQCFRTALSLIRRNPRFKPFRNFSDSDFASLSSLRLHTDLIFNKADKGSNIVIQTRQDYISEIYRQLLNPRHYMRLDEPIFPSTAIKLRKVLLRLKADGFLSDRQVEFLTPPLTPRPRRLYTLPKIHKAPAEWTVPFRIPRGRPIVSDIGSESYNISRFIDHFLKPIMALQPSHVWDSFHFLDKLRSFTNITASTIIVSADVVSMYTNIDNEDGLLAVKSFFLKYPDPSRPDIYILQLLRICLENNDFLFDGQFWLQRSGTAMGKIFAPSYANLFMAWVEERFFNHIGFRPPFYVRFLDDIFFIWTDGLSLLRLFTTEFDQTHPSVKLEWKFSQTSMIFLDLLVFKDFSLPFPQTLCSKVHFKTTNTHRLLHKHSFHPVHTFRGIIKAQLSRFHRLCTYQADFRTAYLTLFKALRAMRYSRRFLGYCLKDFYTSTNKPASDSGNKILIPLVYTYHQQSEVICHSLVSDLLETDDPLFTSCRIIRARRRNRNLAHLIVRNKI